MFVEVFFQVLKWHNIRLVRCANLVHTPATIPLEIDGGIGLVIPASVTGFVQHE